MSILIFGLTRYYYTTGNIIDDEENNNNNNNNGSSNSRSNSSQSTILFFVTIYVVLLLIVGFASLSSSSAGLNSQSIFIPWEQLLSLSSLSSSFIHIIQLAAAIALCFFVPGYAIVMTIMMMHHHYHYSSSTKKNHYDNDDDDNNNNKKKPGLLLRVLLGYLFSILITGLTGYVTASLGFDISAIKIVIISIYIAILAVAILSLILITTLQKKRKQRHSVVRRRRSTTTTTITLLNELKLFFDQLKKSLIFIGYKQSNNNNNNLWTLLRRRSSEILVFASLFGLVILLTYNLYHGTIVGDQWFHHGRSLIFMAGAFKDVAASGTDWLYPPFLSALLAVFFSLSGIPSVNAYVSINFLNIIPVFAFYYFFSKWVYYNNNNNNHKEVRRGGGGVEEEEGRSSSSSSRLRTTTTRKTASLLASTLFMLSSGFGWIYILDTAISQPVGNQMSALEILHTGGIRTFDVRLPNTLVIASHHPEPTGPLIIIALPAGFVLLGLIKENKIRRKSKFFIYFALITAISTLGCLSHDEFNFFVLIASILPLIFRLSSTEEGRKKIFYYYAALLAALSITVLIDLVFPGKYYIIRERFGIPLIALYFLFVAFMWALYASKILHRIRSYYHNNRNHHHQQQHDHNHYHYLRTKVLSVVSKKKKRIIIIITNLFSSSSSNSYHHARFVLGVVLVSVVAYLYVFTFIVWGQLSFEDVDTQTANSGQRDIPWYLYPMKFGVTGLFGLAFILSYLFKKFEKEVFVFGVIAIIAFILGPYYDEHRFGKYIMVGMVGFASLLIHKIIVTIISSSPSSPSSPPVPHLHFLSYYERMTATTKSKIVLCGIVIGVIVTFSSLSIFMFAGYNALALENPDFMAFNKDLGRRNFLSSSEIHFINFLHNNLINLKKDQIMTLENESIRDQDLVAKLEGFLGTSLMTKFLQSPLTLNSSTLEGFYNLLNYSDTRYIILPKKDIIDYNTGRQEGVGKVEAGDSRGGKGVGVELSSGAAIPAPISSSSSSSLSSAAVQTQAQESILQFALDNFQRAYEDDNYIVLTVPPLAPPSSSKGDIALVYDNDQRNGLLLSSSSFTSSSSDAVSDKRILSYDNKLFKKLASSKPAKIVVENENNNKTVTLYSDGSGKKGVILWSTMIKDKKVKNNYIETRFRITSENKEARNDEVSLIWNDDRNNKQYHVSLKSDVIELSQIPIMMKNNDNNDDNNTNNNNKQPQLDKKSSSPLLLSQNREIIREKWIWHTLKIIITQNTIDIYVDDIPRIHTHQRDLPESQHISKVGIGSINNVVEFEPIKIGLVSSSSSNLSANNILSSPLFTSSSSSSPYYYYQKKQQQQQPQEEAIIYNHNYNYYYLLSMLALSKKQIGGVAGGYDTFINGDFAAFSKKYIILASDIPSGLDNNSTINNYLQFVKKGGGGSLIVINTDGKYDGVFSKLLSIKATNNSNTTSLPYNMIVYNSSFSPPSLSSSSSSSSSSSYNREKIDSTTTSTSSAPPTINITGVTNNIEFAKSPDVSVISYYQYRSNNTNNNNNNNGNNNYNYNTSQKIVAPFAIEKNYGAVEGGSGGKIIFVNAAGYFDAISKSPMPGSYFMTLTNLPSLINLKPPNESAVVNAASSSVSQSSLPSSSPSSFSTTTPPPSSSSSTPPSPTPLKTAIPPTRFIGDLKISGQVMINSSSLLFLNGNGSYRPYNFYVKDISFSSSTNHENINNIDNNNQDEYLKKKNNNNNTTSSSKNNNLTTTLVKDLKLYGPYEVSINSTGLLYLPSSALSSSPSQYDYIAISIPVEFDMILKLSNGARAEFTIIRGGSSEAGGEGEEENNYNNNSISNNNSSSSTTTNSSSIIINNNNNNNQSTSRITNGTIHFHGMKTSDFPRITSVPVLVKSPSIQVNGNASFKTIYLVNPDEAKPFASGGSAEVVNGKLITKFDHVDHYNDHYRNGTRTQYVSYLKWINSDETVNPSQGKLQIKLPADTSILAKRRGIEVPWQEAIVSTNSIIVLVSISLVSIIVTWRIWSKIKKFQSVSQ
jgi:hypothetical protein